MTPEPLPKGASHLYKGAMDLYRLNQEADGMLIDQQITRQQLGAFAGLSDDVLAFWIKSGLLVAASGGGGKGSHRRFDGFQVNIAAILAELRSFGMNLAGLRSFATRLQAATALGKSAECNPWAFSDVKDLWHKTDAFKRGEPVLVVPEVRVEKFAESLEDIHHHFRKWPSHLHDRFDNVLKFANRLTQDDLPLLDLFMDVHSEAYRCVYEDRIMSYGDSSWLAVRQSEEEWKIYNGAAGEDPLPYNIQKDQICGGIYLLPGAIIRRAWKGSLSPILFHSIPPSAEERAIQEEVRQRTEQSNREHSVRIAKRILASEKPE